MYENEIRKLSVFSGLKDETVTDQEVEKLMKVINDLCENINFDLLTKSDLSLLIDYLSKTDNLYEINTPLTDGLEASDFSVFDDDLLLMRLPEYALEIKRIALEQKVTFTKSLFFSKKISPYKKTNAFLKKINWETKPSSDELNFLFFLIEDLLSGYLDSSISEKQATEIASKTKRFLDFERISFEYERLGALDLILGSISMGSDDKEQIWSSKVSIYNGLLILQENNYKEYLKDFKDKNKVIIITDNIKNFEEKRSFLQKSRINYYYDRTRSIIKT